MNEALFVRSIDTEIRVLLKAYEERSTTIRSSTQVFVVTWIVLIITTILFFSGILQPRGNLGPLLLFGLQMIMLAYVAFYNLANRVQRRSLQLIEEQINILLGEDTANYELKAAKTFSDFQRPLTEFMSGNINPIKLTSGLAAMAAYATYVSGVQSYLFFSDYNYSAFLPATAFLLGFVTIVFIFADRQVNRRFIEIRSEILKTQVDKWAYRLGVPNKMLAENLRFGVMTLITNRVTAASEKSIGKA